MLLQQGESPDERLPFLRVGHTTVYDPVNKRIVLFGGWNGRTYFSDTWALSVTASDDGAWTKLSPGSILPQPRGFHTAIYDSANKRMVIFGGRSSYNNWNDAWALDLETPGAETWSPLTPAGSPPAARRWHTAIYDAPRHRMVVFGAGRGGLFNDAWALDLTTPGAEAWSPLAVTGSVPSARAQHTAVYNSDDQSMIVFGGAGQGALLNDTWVLSLTMTTPAWNQLPLSPASRPPARRGHTAVYNTTALQPRMEIWGGVGAGGSLNDFWLLDLTPGSIHWYRGVDPELKPSSRAWHTTILTSNQRLYLVAHHPHAAQLGASQCSAPAYGDQRWGSARGELADRGCAARHDCELAEQFRRLVCHQAQDIVQLLQRQRGRDPERGHEQIPGGERGDAPHRRGGCDPVERPASVGRRALSPQRRGPGQAQRRGRL